MERNRLKRRLREIIRLHVLPTLPPFDLVVRTRREAYAASFLALTSELVGGTERLTGSGDRNATRDQS